MLPETTKIDTERLILQEVTPELYELIMTTYSNKEIKYFFGIDDNNELKKEKQRHREGMTSYYSTFRRFVLVERTSGDVIGQCGYHKWYVEHKRAEIGYALRNDNLKRQGYMREALKPILHYGFNDMKLNRIEAYTSPENVASIKLLEGEGFSHEGIMRQHYNVMGKLDDSSCYSLLSKEYFIQNTLPQGVTVSK